MENLRKHILTFVSVLTLLCSCNGGKGETDLSNIEVNGPNEALEIFKTLSPDSGTLFYTMRRADLPFLDSLYEENILPALYECDYYELKPVAERLKETEFEDIVQILLDEKKDELISIVENELDSNLIYEQQFFTEYVMPAISLEVDSLLNEDVKKSMDDYAGGILNYKKLFFFLGRNKDDFKEKFWDNFDLEKYEDLIAKHISSYFDMIGSSQNEYCKQVTGKTFEFEYSAEKRKIKAGLSKPTVKLVHKYTEEEKDGMTKEFIKDWAVPFALGSLTGGVGWVVSAAYDIGNLGYDIKVTLDEMKEMNPSADERISYIVENDLAYQISEYYLSDCKKDVFKELERSRDQLKQYIIENL